MIRISLGLTSLILSILFAAHALGLVPDWNGTAIASRKALTETLAVHCTVAARTEDVFTMQALVEALHQRHSDLLAAVVRRADGRVVAAAGDPSASGERQGVSPPVPGVSSPTHMTVRLVLPEREWGAVELLFRPLPGSGVLGLVGGPVLPLVAFVGLTGFLGICIYLRSVLRHAELEQGRLVPDRVRTTLNTVTEGVLVLDRKQRIALANDAFATKVGRPADELVGRAVSELPWKPLPETLSPETLPWARAMQDSASQTGTILGLETHAAGLCKLSVNSAPLLGDDGVCRGVLATFDDLTPIESKNAQLARMLRRLKYSRWKIREQQKALKKAKEVAEAANKAKGEFLASVSHEIRTPMNAIIGMTEVVLDMPLTRQQQAYLQIVKTSADGLLGVLNEILDYSKIESGKFALDPTEFALRDAVGDTLKLLAVRAHARHLELACDVAPEVPDLLIGDPGRLRQILVNLVGNAIKFTHQGEIVISVSLVSGGVVSGEWSGGDPPLTTHHSPPTTLHFSVRDTGIGIPGAKLKSIFAPFSQADASTTRKYGGTGLGLAISTHLVELMRGRIWVESEVGQGSTFHFTADFGQVARTVPGPDFGVLAGLPALVVDDNASSRRILCSILSRLGLQATSADNGEAALGELERASQAGQPYALLVADVGMPGLDGFALAEAAQLAAPCPPATVLLLSAQDRQTDRALSTTASVTKPIKEADLVKSLQRLLGLRALAESQPNIDLGAAPRRAAPPCPLRILLVDDNPFNQRVGAVKLEILGHQVTVASGGHEALTLLERESFDLTFMDMEMPDMDGLETAAAIRQREQGTGRHLPIVAMTAHASAEARERCLRGGMDGHLTKPIDDKALLAILQQVTPAEPIADCGLRIADSESPRSGEPKATAPSQSAIAPDQSTIDRAAMLARVGGNLGMLRELLEVFAGDCGRLLEELRAGVQQRDGKVVRAAAHTLKGMVSFFGAAAATALTQRLEKMGADSDFTGAQECLADLAHHAGRIQAEVAAVCAADEKGSGAGGAT